MEGNINVLKDLHKTIVKALANFTKSPKDRLTFEYVEARLELLENDWASFKNANTKIYERFALSDIQKHIGDIYDTTEDAYINCKCLMKTKIRKLEVVVNSEKQSSSKPTSSSSSLVKLPRISIPMFSGKYEEWTTFHDLFVSLIHKNSSLDNVQRLHFLKTHLTGEAEQLIRHTPITEANYSQCWELLVKRYSNKKYLVNCILNRLFAQKRLHFESATSLKSILDVTTDCLHALVNLNIDVSAWDVIIIHIVTFKLDPESRKQWELFNHDSYDELPTLNQFNAFIEKRFRALECIQSQKVQHVNKCAQHNSQTRVMLATRTFQTRCEYCSDQHKLCFCKKFAKLTIQNRREFVAKNGICFNCLGSNHFTTDCKKHTTCKLCQRRHHSLLHLNGESGILKKDNKPIPSTDNTDSSPSTGQIVSCFSTDRNMKSAQVLLATALVKAKSKTGEYQTVRALIDQGSQACFITENMVQRLGLKRIPIHGIISGLGEKRSNIAKYMVCLSIKSCENPDFKLDLKAYVLRKITSQLPERSVSMSDFEWIDNKNLRFADPKFNLSNKVDILLGAEPFSTIIQEGLVKSPTGSVFAQNTILGWIVSGAITSSTDNKIKIDTDNRSKNINVMQACVEENNMKKMWKVEERINKKRMLTPEEQSSEEFYSATTAKQRDGRYIGRLPFKETVLLVRQVDHK